MQHYVIKFVGGFLRVPPRNKTGRRDLTEILLKVALDTIHIKATTQERHPR